MSHDEQIVQKYLLRFDLTLKRFEKKEKNKPTPDFKVYKENSLIFYLEVKSVAYNRCNGLRNDPAFNNVSSRIHEAYKQFHSVNPERNIPNVLVFCNYNSAMGHRDVRDTYTGYFPSNKGDLPIYMKYAHGRIKKEKPEISLYVWIDFIRGTMKGYYTDQDGELIGKTYFISQMENRGRLVNYKKSELEGAHPLDKGDTN